MKIACAYIRVSTDDQTELSPTSQINQIREYAKRNDMIVPDEFIFQDDGISGKNTTKRVAFNNMIGVAKQNPKPFDCILVWKFSRFARNREDSIVYKSMLRKELGIDVVSISEHIGDDKMSILIEALIEAMDEYYSINLAEEVRRGMLEKVNRGGVVTGPALGYDVIDKLYVINPVEASHVEMIYNDFLNGLGYREIATKLNDMHITTKRGGGFENRTVEYILRNPLYIGKLRWTPTKRMRRDYNDDDTLIVDGLHTPIVSAELWERVQSRVNEIKVSHKKYVRSATGVEYMARGLLKCSCCGGSLSALNKNGVNCHTYVKGKCSTSHYVSIPILDELILYTLEQVVIDGNFHLVRKRDISNDVNKDVNVKIELELIKLERVKQAYESGIDTIEEYKSNKNRIMLEIDRLKARLVQRDELSDEEVKRIVIENLKQILPQLRSSEVETKEKNELLKIFVDRIVFNRGTNSVELYMHARL